MSSPAAAAQQEQGRAAVLAWQQTIDAAWQQSQTGLAPNQPGAPGPNLDAARQQFFDGPVPPGAQRQIIKTDAIVPGGQDGIIVNRMYIADKLAAFYQLYGDGRGPSTDPAASSRASIAWDTRTGEVSITVNPSTVHENSLLQEQSPFTQPKEVPALPINVGPDSLGTSNSNNFRVTTLPGQVSVQYDLINSGLPDPARWGAVQGESNVSVSQNDIFGGARGEDYPDREVIQYRQDGARMINNIPMGEGGQFGAPIFGTDYGTDRGQWRVPR